MLPVFHYAIVFNCWCVSGLSLVREGFAIWLSSCRRVPWLRKLMWCRLSQTAMCLSGTTLVPNLCLSWFLFLCLWFRRLLPLSASYWTIGGSMDSSAVAKTLHMMMWMCSGGNSIASIALELFTCIHMCMHIVMHACMRVCFYSYLFWLRSLCACVVYSLRLFVRYDCFAFAWGLCDRPYGRWCWRLWSYRRS